MMDRVSIEAGGGPISDPDAGGRAGGRARAGAASRRLVEEIASMRYVLRNVYRLAIAAEETGNTPGWWRSTATAANDW